MRESQLLWIAGLVTATSLCARDGSAGTPAVLARNTAHRTTAARKPAPLAHGDDAKLAPIAAPAPRAAESPRTPPVATVEAFVVEYQRVGHELVVLQDRRGADLAQELWEEFRAIHVDEAIASPLVRSDASATLTDLRERIERRRGVELSADCLNNALAKDCL